MAKTKKKFPEIIGAALIGAVTLFCQIIFPLSLFNAKISPVPVVTANTLSLTAKPPEPIPFVSPTFFFNFFVHFFFPLFLLTAMTFNVVSIVYIFSLSITGCEEIGFFLFCPLPIEIFQDSLMLFLVKGCTTLCASLLVI